MEESVVARCPWCSAELADAPAATCPTCGATLVSASEPQIPGLTTISPELRVRPRPRRRNRLLAWINGDSDDDELAPAPAGALAVPSDAVLAEIRRLQGEAGGAGTEQTAPQAAPSGTEATPAVGVDASADSAAL